MGSYAEIWLGSLHVATTKNEIDPALMLLFRSSDKVVLDARTQRDSMPSPVREWAVGLELEDDEYPSVVFYKAPVTVIRDRLELKGTFMDFEGARVAGGAGGLANMVKAFAGAGILNKVVAIFDNDTAAEAAIRSLRNIRPPTNIQIMKLPPCSSLNDYPTVGPSGPVTMNVNGIAGSIEPYLGNDVLREEDSKLAPVQWTGYEAGVGKYQGEVLFKDRLHERFKKKLQASSDAEILEAADWVDIRLVLSTIFRAFHGFDEKHILSRINPPQDD